MQDQEQAPFKLKESLNENGVLKNSNQVAHKSGFFSSGKKVRDVIFGGIIAGVVYYSMGFFFAFYPEHGNFLFHFILQIVIFALLILGCVWKGRKYMAAGIAIVGLYPLVAFGSCGLLMFLVFPGMYHS